MGTTLRSDAEGEKNFLFGAGIAEVSLFRNDVLFGVSGSGLLYPGWRGIPLTKPGPFQGGRLVELLIDVGLLARDEVLECAESFAFPF